MAANLGMQNGEKTQGNSRGPKGNESCAGVSEDRVEHESAQNGCPQPQNQDAATLTVAKIYQSMMQMPFVGGGQPLSASGPTNDGKNRVQDRNTKDEQGNE
jgi:hypothetical protein